MKLSEALEAGSAWAAAREQADATFTEAAFRTDPRLRTLSRGEPGARDPAVRGVGLPKSPADRLRLVDTLITVRELRKTLSENERVPASLLGPERHGERTPFAALQEQAARIARLTAIAPIKTSEAPDRVCGAADSAA